MGMCFMAMSVMFQGRDLPWWVCIRGYKTSYSPPIEGINSLTLKSFKPAPIISLNSLGS